MILVSSLRFALNFLILISLSSPTLAWTVFENGSRRPLLLHGAGDVNSRDLPDALQSSMTVDPLTRTVEWQGDRGRIRAAAGERLVIKNGRRVTLPRPVRLYEFSVIFPEELLKNFADIFSFVETSSGADGDILNIQEKSPILSEPSPDIQPVPENPAAPPAPASSRSARSRTIVIDPGHGGTDPGAKGKAGAVEKDIVLAIGLALAQTLKERDPSMKIVLTRGTDDFITLPGRAKLANTQKCDLFVSIHANSVKRNADAGGFEVYHLSVEGANDDARAVAAFENSEAESSDKNTATGAPNFELQQILGDVMQLQYINASLELSTQVGAGMAAALEGASKFRGTKGAFFYVLKDVLAPAILIEVGFVTNDWEASFLQKPWYQRKIADGIADGILNFSRAEDSRMNPNSGGMEESGGTGAK